MSVEIQNISKHFGHFTALHDVSLQVRSGELLALLGPSGCGKTTLLRIIGGLEFPDAGAGRILLHGEDVTQRSPRDRQVGFLFQHYALFRHLTVFENVAFGLRVRPRSLRPTEELIKQKVASLLTLVQLEDLAGRFPGQLSGGQRQRVALARALAVEPKVLLLDEPFGALDAKVRRDLRRWIRRLHNEIHLTSILVTHDQDEALDVASRVVVMNQGRIEQTGTPDEVYDSPSNPFVFNFLGRVISLRGRLEHGRLRLAESWCEAPDHASVLDAPVTVYARPQDVRIAPPPTGVPHLEALVRDVNLAGPVVYLELERADDGAIFELEATSQRHGHFPIRPGSRVHVSLERYRIFLD